MTRGGRGLRLTVDCGNSRAKLALWGEGAECVGGAAFAYGADLVREVQAWLRDRPPIVLAGLSSVTTDVASEALCEVLAERVGDLRIAPDPGLENRTRDPAGTGLDRLYAARGALFHTGRAAIVVDVGSAMTVDAVLSEGGGAFLGGAIAPGPELSARALAREGARLFDVTPDPGARALGRDTAEAIGSGIAVGVRGAARTLADEVAREAGIPDAPLALTGGARAFVRDAFPGRQVHEDADLVHRGLLLALEALP